MLICTRLYNRLISTIQISLHVFLDACCNLSINPWTCFNNPRHLCLIWTLPLLPWPLVNLPPWTYGFDNPPDFGKPIVFHKLLIRPALFLGGCMRPGGRLTCSCYLNPWLFWGFCQVGWCKQATFQNRAMAEGLIWKNGARIVNQRTYRIHV